jgi:hypothetical protein
MLCIETFDCELAESVVSILNNGNGHMRCDFELHTTSLFGGGLILCNQA